MTDDPISSAASIKASPLRRNRVGIRGLLLSLGGTVLVVVSLFLQSQARRGDITPIQVVFVIASLLLCVSGFLVSLCGLIWRPRRYSLCAIILACVNYLLFFTYVNNVAGAMSV